MCQVWGYCLIRVDSWRCSVCSRQAAVLLSGGNLIDERRRGAEREQEGSGTHRFVLLDFPCRVAPFRDAASCEGPQST